MSETVSTNGEPRDALRLAICGNVFPGDDLESVTQALAGPWQRFQDSIGPQASAACFGLYLGHQAASALLQGGPESEAMAAAVAIHSQGLWTGNAFPYGGFHGAEVKRKAFRPSWDQPERLAYTLEAAEALSRLARKAPNPQTRLSLSTCPLGYGEDPLDEEQAIAHLRAFAQWAEQHQAECGTAITLALEPEPDGRLERVEVLANWLASAFSPEERRYLGICWDICHAEVVGESAETLLGACRRLDVRIAKVQVSAALQVEDAAHPAARERLAVLAQDPYLHQVRGHSAAGQPLAFADLGPALEAPVTSGDQWRIHCHVPIHFGDLGDGLAGTAWRPSIAAARASGIEDYELETYTLPVLPQSLRAGGVVETMVEEWHALQAALGLTGP